ncbi:MAG TPA: adenylate/guanylate cyclase domain-containing protein [Casimicrobiaceae bacterium]
MTRDHRRLAAIVSADVVGYSLLMGRDDSATLAGLKGHRQEVIDPKIAEYGGRIVKTTGDGLLLEFPSVVDAVRCAVDVQRGMAERNVDVSPERRIEFRIGINVGDIIIDGDDIFGDGVNVAARLQTLAEPGGICVSKVVRDQVLDKLSFDFEDLGPQEVKNIVRPVEVYRVALGGKIPVGRGRVGLPRSSLLRWAGLAAGFAALAVMGATLLWWQSHRDAKPPPFAMSVAVLPFTAYGGTSADARLADTLTSNVTNVLSRDYWTRVVAQGQVGTTPSEPRDLLRLGRELNVRYLTVGEVHRNADKIVILIRLVNAETGTDDWGDRFEFEATQLENEQVRAAERIERRLWNGVLAAARRHAKANPALGDPWNRFLRASDAYEKDGDRAVARKQMEEVLSLDPDFVPALATEANIIISQLSEETEANSPRVRQEKEDLERLSSRAVVLGESDSWAWQIRAEALTWLGRWEEALAANDHARALDPGSVRRVLDRARVLLRMGRADEALSVIQKARAMDPPRTADVVDASYFSGIECLTNLALGNYREATPQCEQVGASGSSWRAQVLLVAVYAQQNEMAKADAAKSAALRLRPTLSIAQLKAMPQAGNQLYLDLLEMRYYPGLRKAGIPEK